MVADWTKILEDNNSINREAKKFSDPNFIHLAVASLVCFDLSTDHSLAMNRHEI